LAAVAGRAIDGWEPACERPGHRFQNLFGLAAGPLVAGVVDAIGLETALTLTPLGCVVAALSFLAAPHLCR
jgi:hypothetical protein